MSVPASVDVVVVGSGINGLVAAAVLAGSGWEVVLVERNQQLGGLIASGEDTLPGYVHDRFSSWHPLFVGGGVWPLLGEDLVRHGLEYRNTDGAVTASLADDGRVTVAHRDPARTAASFTRPTRTWPTSPTCTSRPTSTTWPAPTSSPWPDCCPTCRWRWSGRPRGWIRPAHLISGRSSGSRCARSRRRSVGTPRARSQREAGTTPRRPSPTAC